MVNGFLKTVRQSTDVAAAAIAQASKTYLRLTEAICRTT